MVGAPSDAVFPMRMGMDVVTEALAAVLAAMSAEAVVGCGDNGVTSPEAGLVLVLVLVRRRDGGAAS